MHMMLGLKDYGENMIKHHHQMTKKIQATALK